MSPLSTVVATALILATSLGAQTAEEVTSGLDFAKYEIDQKRPEKAASALREAYALMKVLPSDEKRKVGKAEKELTKLLKKTDPKGKLLIDNRVRAATAMLKLGRGYAKRGWNETALSVFLKVQALQPQIVKKDLEAVRKVFAADAGKRFEKAGKNKDLLTWFHLGERHGFNRTPWQLSDYGILAPKTDTDRGVPTLVSNKPLNGDVLIKVEVKPGPSGIASFVWNYRRTITNSRYMTSYTAIELNPQGAEAMVHMSVNNNMQVAGKGTIIMNSFKNDWIPVEIEQRGENVIIRLPKNDPIKFRSFAPNKGSLALMFQTKKRTDPQAEFRHLSIKHLD